MITRTAAASSPAACATLALTLLGALAAPGLAAETHANPAGGTASIVLEPVPTPATVRSKRTVFVCRDGAGPVYADRPCGQVVASRSLDVRDPGPGQVASTVRKPAPAAIRPRIEPEPAAPDPSPGETRCVKLRKQLAALDDRMRAGYSARESAWLWNRWRDLKAQIHAARC